MSVERWKESFLKTKFLFLISQRAEVVLGGLFCCSYQPLVDPGSCLSALFSQNRTLKPTTGSSPVNNTTMNNNFFLGENESHSEKDEQCCEELYSQVGGHVNMKTLNERYVCKPLNIRELSFYQNLPAELSVFVPTYHGTVSLDSNSQPR